MGRNVGGYIGFALFSVEMNRASGGYDEFWKYSNHIESEHAKYIYLFASRVLTKLKEHMDPHYQIFKSERKLAVTFDEIIKKY